MAILEYRTWSNWQITYPHVSCLNPQLPEGMWQKTTHLHRTIISQCSMENPQQFIVDTLRYKKKRGKNVRKSQDSNVDFPNETSMACAVRGPIPSPAVSWWNPKKIEWWFHHPNHSEWRFHNHKIDNLPSLMFHGWLPLLTILNY